MKIKVLHQISPIYRYNLCTSLIFIHTMFIHCTYELSNSIDAEYDDATYAHHATFDADRCYQQQCVEYQQRLDVCCSKLE